MLCSVSCLLTLSKACSKSVSEVRIFHKAPLGWYCRWETSSYLIVFPLESGPRVSFACGFGFGRRVTQLWISTVSCVSHCPPVGAYNHTRGWIPVYLAVRVAFPFLTISPELLCIVDHSMEWNRHTFSPVILAFWFKRRSFWIPFHSYSHRLSSGNLYLAFGPLQKLNIPKHVCEQWFLFLLISACVLLATLDFILMLRGTPLYTSVSTPMT